MTTYRKIQMKRGLQSNLPALDVAEFGFTTDARKTYIGSSVGNIQMATIQDVADAVASIPGGGGTGDMKKSDYDTNNNGTVDQAEQAYLAAEASRLSTPRNINITGFATGSATFDGTSDITIATTGSGGGGGGDMFKATYDTNNNGSVDKAEKLTTARNINITGSVTGAAVFDGSSDITITTTGGSGDMLKSVYDTNNDGIIDRAAKLATARTISLTGAVTGTASFDGTANISIATSGALGAGGNVSFVVTPEQYGAIPNGTFDCTAAIQSAMNAIEAAGGGTLQLSSGVYVTSYLKIVAQCLVQGNGWGSVLKLKNGTNGHLIQPKDELLSNFTLQDFAVDGNNANNSSGSGVYIKKNPSGSGRASYLYHTSNGQDINSLIRNLLVYNCADHGIFLDVGSPTTNNIRAMHIEQCHIQHCSKNGVYAVNASDSKFTNVIVMGCGDAGFRLDGGANNHFLGCKGFYNTQNASTTAMGEFHLNAIGRSNFVLCEAQEGVKHGFYFYQCSLLSMAACITDSNGQGSTGFYGYYVDGCTYMNIDNSSATSFHGSGAASWQWRALYVNGGNNNRFNIMVKQQMDSTLYLVNGSPGTTTVLINFVQQYPAGGSSGGGGGTSSGGMLATILFDTFTRANGALGSAYTITAGTWNVTSNQAVLTTTAGGIDRAIIDAVADVTIQAKFVSASGHQKLVFRHSDTGNEWQFGNINGSGFYRLQKRVAGSNTIVQTSSVAVTANDVVKVVCSGNTITCYVNGAVALTSTADAFNNTAIKAGMAGEATSGIIFDDLIIGMALS